MLPPEHGDHRPGPRGRALEPPDQDASGRLTSQEQPDVVSEILGVLRTAERVSGQGRELASIRGGFVSG